MPAITSDATLGADADGKNGVVGEIDEFSLSKTARPAGWVQLAYTGQSGNDASVALAEHVAGTESAFAEAMNHHAQALGMAHSHFMNSTGLPDPEHYTTARDLATLSSALIRDFPDIYAYFKQPEFI